MRYIADVAGIDTVAIGSDFDGIECGLEMKDYSGFPGLIAAMEKEFSPSEIDKICYQNALRVFADVLHYIAPALFFPRWGLVYRI